MKLLNKTIFSCPYYNTVIMKKPIVILLVIVILCIGAVSAFLLWKRKPQIVSVTQTQNQPVEELVLWEDQAGFSFKYPKTISFDKHDEDEVNYAHIEFTSATHSGRLIVWAKDTMYPDVSSWVTKDKSFAGTVSVDTTLGGQPAKKIIISTPSKKVIIGTISDQILFTIEAEPTEGDPYWIDVAGTIASSFAFTPTETTNDSASEEASYDEEEVVE